jgi:CHAD domain-containing protein
MTSATLLRRWTRRLEGRLDELPALVRRCRAGGNATDVHELRVALRRARLLLRVGQPLIPAASASRFRDWAKSVAQVTSRVRDLDVAIEWLTAKPGSAEAVEAIAARRDRGWRTAQPRLRALPAGLLAGLRKIPRGRKAAARLAKRYRKVANRLANAVRKELFGFDEMLPEARHEFRRTLRRWRYLHELSRPRRRHKSDKLLALLVGAQEAIGDLQNAGVTLAALDPLGPSGSVLTLRRWLARERSARSDEIRASLASLAKWMEWPAPGTERPDQSKADNDRPRPRRSRQ